MDARTVGKFWYAGKAVAVGSLLALLGCGGSGPGPGAYRLRTYGAVNSPIVDSLRFRAPVQAISSMSELRPGDVIVIDGNSIPANTLATNSFIEEAFASKALILFVDVGEAHKTALREAGMTNASVTGESFAVLFQHVPIPGSDQHQLWHTELGSATNKYTTSEQFYREGQLVKGKASQETVRHRLTPHAINRYVAAVERRIFGSRIESNATNAPVIPPAGVNWFSEVIDLTETAQASNLNNQQISENVPITFTVYNNPGAGTGPFSQVMAVSFAGQYNVGPLTVAETAPADPGFIGAYYGWYQTVMNLTISPNSAAPSSAQLTPGTANVQDAGGLYWYNVSAPMFAGTETSIQPWTLNMNVPDLPYELDDWDTNPPDGSSLSKQFQFFQSNPYNGVLLNYQNAWGPNGFEPMSQASQSSGNIYGLTLWLTTSLITGPVAMNVDASRTYTRIYIEQSVTNPLSGGVGGTTVVNEGNRLVVLNFNRATPSGGGTGMSKEKK